MDSNHHTFSATFLTCRVILQGLGQPKRCIQVLGAQAADPLHLHLRHNAVRLGGVGAWGNEY